MIKKLRDFHSPEYLAQLYAQPHNHHIFGRGHHIRVELTKVLYKEMCGYVNAKVGADLSCGNAAIIKSFPLETEYLGDFAKGYHFVGPLHETLQQLPEVDIYICSETLEHLEKPLENLTQIRGRSKSLVLTTPLEKWDDILDEHYWAWDREGVEQLLTDAGWKVVNFVVFDSTVFGEPYKYGMWCCV